MAAPDFQADAVRNKFATYPDAIREKLLELRSLIYEVAAEPAYLNPAGTTIRINAKKGSDNEFGLYVHCQTDLLDRYRALYSGDLRFEGNRAILFKAGDRLPIEPLRHCIAMALLYHHT